MPTVTGYPFHLVLLGPPGAGKSTQTARLLEWLPITPIATGTLLRAEVAAGSSLGRAIASMMQQGQLVPDDLILSIVQQQLRALPANQGFLLDGFPRNGCQAEALSDLLDHVGRPLDMVIALTLPVEEAVRRLSARAVCTCCSAITTGYSGSERCACGGTLQRRADDEPTTIRQRQLVYDQSTAPLLNYYRRHGLLVEVDASQAPDVIYAMITAALEQPQMLELGGIQNPGRSMKRVTQLTRVSA